MEWVEGLEAWALAKLLRKYDGLAKNDVDPRTVQVHIGVDQEWVSRNPGRDSAPVCIEILARLVHPVTVSFQDQDETFVENCTLSPGNYVNAVVHRPDLMLMFHEMDVLDLDHKDDKDAQGTNE